MEANELRIGNLISYGAHGISTVVDIRASGKIKIHIHSEDSHAKGYIKPVVHCLYLDPIPLTPEWLERMGFQTETIPDVVDDEGDIIKGYTHWTNGKFCFHFSNGKVEGREHIKYVHLLQNWYYFNTFEELQIK